MTGPRADRPRVLFFGEGATLSHVVRPAVLAAGLDPDRYRTFLACDPRYRPVLGEGPWEPVAIRSLPSDEVLLRLYTGQPLFDPGTLERYVREDLRVIGELRPDLVVGDLRQSLAVSAALAGVPYVNVINAHWSPFASTAFELAEHPMVDLVGEPLAQMLFQLGRPLGFAVHTLPLNLVRMAHGLGPLSLDVREVYCHGDYTVYPDLPHLVPTSPLPPNHLFVGPVLWSPPGPEPEWWSDLPEDRPTVYVSLGSSGQHDLLGVVLDALADLPVTVVASTAGRATPNRPPANARLAPYLPGDAAAARSRLVICNGGTTSVHQALAAGAPVLGLVSNMDQLAFARKVVEAGAGRVLREGRTDRSAVRSAVVALLDDPGYREAAGRIALAMERYRAPERFAALVDRILEPATDERRRTS
ncbi:MAG: glycosyltransferase [Acidobacteriota bacterium]|jgi:UDP:flavonoid glycosyltransferase YjiC (YdhE family)